MGCPRGDDFFSLGALRRTNTYPCHLFGSAGIFFLKTTSHLSPCIGQQGSGWANATCTATHSCSSQIHAQNFDAQFVLMHISHIAFGDVGAEQLPQSRCSLFALLSFTSLLFFRPFLLLVRTPHEYT